jgi:predicted nucleic acid-binding protein
MRADVFFDTSVLLYVITDQDPRAAIAETLLLDGGLVSAQVLNEFAAVATRKYRMNWAETEAALARIRLLCGPVLPVTLRTHQEGVEVAKRYGYHIYDSLMIAAAIAADCITLYSEDIRDGQRIGKLTIRNPF